MSQKLFWALHSFDPSNNNNFIGKHKVFTVSVANYSGFKLLQ